MSNSSGHDDFGPFTGYELAQGLCCLRWWLALPPRDADEAPLYRHPEVDNEVVLDWAAKNICWGDRSFELLAEQMVSRGVAGRTYRRAVAQNAQDLLEAVRRYKEKRRRGDS